MSIFRGARANFKKAAIGSFIVSIFATSALHAQIISTIAGNGIAGFSGDGGLATAAELDYPQGLVLSPQGDLFISDQLNERIRVVSAGVISTFAGNGQAGYSGDGGDALSAEFHYPTGTAFDAAGNFYMADTFNSVVREITTDGIVSTFAGGRFGGFFGDGGPASAAQLDSPTDVSVDASGNVYIADLANNRIRKVSTDGTITTIAGNGVMGYAGDGGLATNAELSRPMGVLSDGAGDLYIVDTQNYCIRKITPDGVIATVAGNGTPGYSGDGGPAVDAQLAAPSAVALYGGMLLIGDTLNNRVRQVDAHGVISTFAGNGTPGYSGDGGNATDAELNGPTALAVGAGAVYIADTDNQRVRMVFIERIFSNGFDP